MILSMTGYAQLKQQTVAGEIDGEVKSVNSRYLEISFKLPRIFSSYEYALRDLVKNYISRGKVMIAINLTSISPDFSAVDLNMELLKAYHMQLNRIKEEFRLEEPVTLTHLLQFRDIFENNINEGNDETLLHELKNFLKVLMDKHRDARFTEGQELERDIRMRLEMIGKWLEEIKPMARENPRLEFERQKQRLFQLLEGNEIDENRLIQELAIISDKVDITEEIVRLESHLNEFKKIMESTEPVGKKLNFLLQEIHRELNTMGVKTTLVDISYRVVRMKEEAEKIREQIQNIE